MSVVSTSSVNSSSSKSHLIDVPTHWRHETQHCLDTKAVSDEARNDLSGNFVLCCVYIIYVFMLIINAILLVVCMSLNNMCAHHTLYYCCYFYYSSFIILTSLMQERKMKMVFLHFYNSALSCRRKEPLIYTSTFMRIAR